jgi:5-methyltetrahydropteroyltriglutamate--homocysteine methyltransferase
VNAPPFRAEHIGSLLRPQRLLQDRSCADECIVEAIRWQESLGLKVVTDGEFRRESWRLGFVSKVAGFARADALGNVDLQRDEAGNVMRVGSAPVAVTRIRRSGPIVADEVGFSLKHTPLHAAGGRYLQIDEVAQTLLCDQKLREAVRARGDDPENLIDLYIDLINRVVRERPAGMTVGVHMCRGNAMGKWIAEGGYERIAEKSFSRMEVDAFFLEFDSERAGGFEPLRFVPNGKRVVLGLVSTKTPALEDKDALKKKIDAAARFIALDNLSISPQCGFASHEKGTMLSFRDQEVKLRRVVETAMEVWGQA